MRCQLCGFEFDEKIMTCHSSCAFNKSCGVICCPNCGYQVIDEQKSRVAVALKRLLSHGSQTHPQPGSVCPLTEMQPGQSGTVVEITSVHLTRIERLHVLGLVEDAPITLEQKSPTFVLHVGFTQLSVEREIAEDILVKLTP